MSKEIIICSFFVVLSIIVSNEAARILVVVPTAAISHQVVFRPLTQELAKRGHEVVVVTTDPAFPKGKAPANLTEIDIGNETYNFLKEFKKTVVFGDKQEVLYQFANWISDSFKYMFARQLANEEYLQLIQGKKQHFDLLILEAWVRPILAFSHAYKAPVIQASSFLGFFDNYQIIGAPSHPILYPIFTRHRLYNLTIWEKVREMYNNYIIEKAIYDGEKQCEELLRKVVDPDMPSLQELSNNVDMLFLNVHPIWDSNRPVPPGVVYMGGIHMKPPKELPKELKTYLDSSVNGVIYISFGTTVSTANIPKDMIQKIIQVVSQLPYDVLWKWDQDELPGRTQNIRISKWLPQSDLLRHPKVKLFIMQGGLQSTDEAISAGVPMIGIPMLGDQWYDVEKYVYHKIGIKLEIEEFTTGDLKNAIDTIIGDKSYRDNVVKLGELMRDQPETPLERAIWWIEHLLRHGGGRHLRAPAANMSWTEYLELELVFTLIVGLLLSLTLLLLLFKYVLSFIFGRPSIVQRKKKN